MADTDDTTTTDGEKPESTEATQQKSEQEIADFTSWVADQPKSVRDAYELHTAGLTSALDKERKERKQFENTAKAAVERQLEADQKFEELAASRAEKLAKLQPVADSAEAYKSALQKSNDMRIATIPEELRTMVPLYDDPVKVGEWLDANATKLRKPTPPEFDGGVLGSGNKDNGVDLNSREKALARKAGMTEEEYAKNKDKE